MDIFLSFLITGLSTAAVYAELDRLDELLAGGG